MPMSTMAAKMLKKMIPGNATVGAYLAAREITGACFTAAILVIVAVRY